MSVKVSVGLGNRGEVGDELDFGGNLQVLSGHGLAVVHGVLFHVHERGVWHPLLERVCGSFKRYNRTDTRLQPALLNRSSI